MKKSNFFFFFSTKDSKTTQAKKMKPEDIEKQHFKSFYNTIAELDGIKSDIDMSDSYKKISLSEYVDSINDYKHIIEHLYNRRVKNNTNSELKNSIFKNRVIVNDFRGSSFMDNITKSSFKLNDLLEIKYWLSRVKKISGGWFSVWNDNAKNCCEKLTELLDKYLDSFKGRNKTYDIKLRESELSLLKSFSLKSDKRTKSLFDNDSTQKNIEKCATPQNVLQIPEKKPSYIGGLQKCLNDLNVWLDKNVNIFDIAKFFGNFFINLLSSKDLALYDEKLWTTIRHDKSKLEILKKDNSNNILNLLIWQIAADEILTQLQDSDTVKVNPKLLTKIENLVKQQREMESKKGNPGSNPVKDEEKSRRLFIKCSSNAKRLFSKRSKDETCNERSEWFKESLLPLLSDFVEALVHLNSFIRCAYFNRIGKKSKLYEQLKNNIESLSIFPVTSAIGKVSNILSSTENMQNFLSSAEEWLPNLLNIKPYINSSWDGEVYSHIKSLNEIRETVEELVSNSRNVSMDSNKNKKDDNSNNQYRNISKLRRNLKSNRSSFSKNSSIRSKNSLKTSDFEFGNFDKFTEESFSSKGEYKKELSFESDLVNQSSMYSKKSSNQNLIDFLNEASVDMNYSKDEDED